MSVPAYEIMQHVGDDGVVRLALKGEFDIASAVELREVMVRAVGDGQFVDVYVDLDQATFIDSQTIGALVWGHHAARDAAVGLRVINAHGPVLRVLEITGVWELLGSPAGDPSQPT